MRPVPWPACRSLVMPYEVTRHDVGLQLPDEANCFLRVGRLADDLEARAELVSESVAIHRMVVSQEDLYGRHSITCVPPLVSGRTVAEPPTSRIRPSTEPLKPRPFSSDAGSKPTPRSVTLT